MLKTFDRYLIRETLVPMLLGLVILTFVLLIPPILRDAEALIAQGVEWPVIGRVLLTLLPSALSLTIPMAVLLGILVALGRLSADRELVAIQACGVSLYRLLRPMACIALVGAAATAYEIIVALPNANQTFQLIKFTVAENRVEGHVEPRVFFDEFPGRTLYVREVAPGGIWRGVFLADTTAPDRRTVYLAKEGRLMVNREKRTVVIELTDVSRHATLTSKPEEYEGGEQRSVLLALDPNSVLPRLTLVKGPPEMTIAELKASIEDAARRGEPGYLQQFTIAQKFSIPFAPLVLALIGLALGASHRKDGRLASFVLGFGVIFTYYVLLWTARAAAISGRFPATYAPWIPNVVFGVAGLALLRWRAGSADEPMRISLPAFWRRPAGGAPPAAASDAGRARTPGRVVLAIRVPYVRLPRPALLDLYVSGQYLRVFGLGVFSLLGIFYIATFMDLADKLFRGTATTGLLLRYFYFETPQYVYYIIPLAVLIATLVTIGVMTKQSELVVIRACGVSLYRTAAPLVFFGVLASAALFGLQERVLASSNKHADELNREIRGLRRLSPYDRRWIVGESGDIYHYDDFDQGRNVFGQLTIYHLNPDGLSLGSVTHAARVIFEPQIEGVPRGQWTAFAGWSREFSVGADAGTAKAGARYVPFEERRLWLEAPEYFKTDEPSPDQMTYSQLRAYVARLRSRGDAATSSQVWLQRKTAFPFVALVMTLIAVPFAVTTGRRGALYGIGIGIVLAIAYWLMLSVFGAVGAGGLLSPVLAAWTPNILFAAAAVYMLLTVRT